MEHVLRGQMNKQIAADLKIARKTEKTHRSRVMAKLGVRSVTELVRNAAAAGVQSTQKDRPVTQRK
jgi:FixJ family two-component response regulator